MAPEAIPLRTLTTLLNYERLVSDPRYKRTSLHSSTISDQTILPHLEGNALIKKRPASIQKINVHTFHHDASTPDSTQDLALETSTTQATCTIHPSCDVATRSLSSTQLENIFYESRSHDGCYKALILFQEFFAFFLVNPFPRSIIEFKVTGPKLMSVQSLKLRNGGATYITGGENEGFHSILGFPKPGTSVGQIVNFDEFFVVDMTRMQWGKLGIFGEPYFLGKGGDWQDAMDTICDDMKELGIGASWIAENQHTELMRKCAKKAWDRWNDRENAGWCDYCGVGGKLSACAESYLPIELNSRSQAEPFVEPQNSASAGHLTLPKPGKVTSDSIIPFDIHKGPALFQSGNVQIPYIPLSALEPDSRIPPVNTPTGSSDDNNDPDNDDNWDSG
ncbi:uncharacterized protein EAF02_006088 [Botrytis sinoallii]|uniref:uncharacterized protein n=1 Tax=Botrytis sinoallii TaxID=1463999 RepID=UPI00190092EC|nr:uncharacterized protein EAF02_006088 [Botrytis sinoallii]KAF7882725.1 hypothetical protein EAF02_006088 [Botrytis sinoallii]